MKALITVALALALSSCTLQVSPDGSRTWTANPEVILILLDK